MSNFHFLTHPTDFQIDEILDLYRLAGWWESSGDTGRDRSLVRGIVGGSYCFLVAATTPEPEAPLIGMGRSISDGVSDAYIQDVVVARPFRGRGVATEIVGRILRKLQDDGIEWIGLIAENNTQTLYQPLGFASMADSLPMLYRKK